MTQQRGALVRHIKNFLQHRGIQVTAESTRPPEGVFSKFHPETYVHIQISESEIFVYGDGQVEIRKAGQSLGNFEPDDCSNLQDLESRVFGVLSDLFGPLPSR